MDGMSEEARARWGETFYQDELPDNIGRMRTLLETYSKIPPEEVDDHLYNIRAKAWAVHQYPCIGRWTWTQLGLAEHAHYKAALARLTAPGSTDAFVEVAACLGQVIRQLASDGVPGSRLYGTDLHASFLELSFELFRDRDTLGATLAAGDMLAEPVADPTLAPLQGKATIIHAANFFHLFRWDDQVRAGRRMVGFLQPGTKDAMVFGGQIGSVKAGEFAPAGRGTRYWHDAASFQRLWDEIGAATGTAWRTEVEVLGGGRAVPLPGFGEESRYFRFVVHQTA